MKRLAILISVHNDQDGLERTIRSLVVPEGGEIFVVDDGSAVPLSLPEELPAPTTMLWLEQNLGLTAALNRGLAAILEEGFEYVARIDAGDLARHDRFERQLDLLDSDPDLMLVGSHADVRAEDGITLFQIRTPETPRRIRKILHLKNCFTHSSICLRAAVLREAGVYDERFKTAQDYELCFRIARRHKAANIPEPLVSCEVSKGISRHRRKEQVRATYQIQRRYFDPVEPLSYLGLARTMAHMLVPFSALTNMKRILWRNARSSREMQPAALD